MAEGVLIMEYNTVLLSDSRIRKLLSTVVQNATDETQDNIASRAALVKLVNEDTTEQYLNEPRRKIISWLNQCQFQTLTSKFWFEMHTRMAKILTVSIVLESLNLRSFGVEHPEKSDIPTAIVRLYSSMRYYVETGLEKDRADYLKLVNSKSFKEFTDLYC